MKKRNWDEDIRLLDDLLFPLGIVTGLLGIGAGLMICFHVL